MKKYNFYSILTVMVFTLFIFIPSVRAEKNDDEIQNWQVFMYVAGENLESVQGYWSKNVKEIESEIPKPGISYTVNFGGAKSSATMGESLKHEQYLVWSSDSNGWKNVLDEERPAPDMGSMTTLRNFMEYTDEEQAKHKVLVFWNHGGGSLFGVCHDENTDSMLSLDSMRNAIGEIYDPDPANPPFDIIFFNACLMGNIDTLKALNGFTRYVVASEEVAPGEGMDYSVMVKLLNNNPDIKPVDLAKSMCDAYMDKCVRNETDWCATMSVVDMSKLDKLVEAYDKFGAAVLAKVEENPKVNIRDFVRNTYWVEDYGGNTDTSGYFNMMDMRGMAMGNKKLVPKEANALIKAVDSAVIHNRHGKYRSSSAGISLYYPMDANMASLAMYNGMEFSSPVYVKLYDTLLKHTDDYNLQDLAGKKISVNSNNRFEVNLSQNEMDKLIDMVGVMGYVTPEGKRYFLGADDRVDFAKWKKGIFTDDDLGDWISLNGHFLCTTIEDLQYDYTVLSAPIIWNDILCDMVFIYNFKTKTYEIAGLTYADDKERHMLANPYKGRIKKGDKITVMYRPYEMENNNIHLKELVKGDTFVLTEEPKITDSDLLPDGQYEFFFIFVNPLGIPAFSEVGNLNLVKGDPVYPQK